MGACWVSTDEAVAELDLATLDTVRTAQFELNGNIACGSRYLWVHDEMNADGERVVARFDPRAFEVSGSAVVGKLTEGPIIDSSDRPWVATELTSEEMSIHGTHGIRQVDPVTLDITLVVRMPERIQALTSGLGCIWFVSKGMWAHSPCMLGRVKALDREIGRPEFADIDDIHCHSVAVHGASVWCGRGRHSDLLQIDAESLEKTSEIATPDRTMSIVADETSLWLLHRDGVISQLDPRKGEIAATYQVDPSIDQITAGQGFLLLASSDEGMVMRADLF